MIKRFLGVLLIGSIGTGLQAQYSITSKHEVTCTAVKNQQRTGTCWSFATSSFLESEIQRTKKMDVDLSEMFNVRCTYMDKARNYLLRQGKANFSQGSLSHDVIRVLEREGVVPEAAFSGKADWAKMHDHGELLSASKGLLDGLNKRETLSPVWKDLMGGILDVYMGKAPDEFSYQGKTYTARSFADYLGLKASDYISLSSYTHHPFYRPFILEVPDNYSNGWYQNIPLDELEATVDAALKNGYSVAWDGDVSDEFFSHKRSLAILPVTDDPSSAWGTPLPQQNIDQAKRQQSFESKNTTDDHLMHLVGIGYDAKGTKYYKVKNSWGSNNHEKGYLHMSAAYFRLHTVGVLLHKSAIPMEISKKFQ